MLSVIIPLFGHPHPNFAQLIEQLLDAISEWDGAEVVVVHSRPGDAPLPSGIRTLTVTRRLLPSEAKNRGAFSARNPVLMFIDSDNLVAPDTIARLVSLIGTGLYAAVAASTHYLEDPDTVAFYGASHRAQTGRTRFLRTKTAPESSTPRLLEIDVAANAYVTTRELFTEIGGFDEATFPCHFEESDLSYRLRSASGKHLVADTLSVVWNDMPVIAGERLAAKDWVRSYYNARSRPLFLARHMSIGKWLMYLLLWQFAFVAAYIVGEIGAMGGRRGLRHCVANIIAYMFGMLNGALASVVLLFSSEVGRGTSRDVPPRSSRLASSLTEECSIVHRRDYPTEAR